MTDNLIFELDYYQEIGEEIANKLNENYIISQIEIITNTIFSIENSVSYICLDVLQLSIYLNNYYNNIGIYDVSPLLYKNALSKIHLKKTDKFTLCIGTNYKLKIIIKPILKKYYRSLVFNNSDNYHDINICSNSFKNMNELKKYLSDVSIINADLIINDICSHC